MISPAGLQLWTIYDHPSDVPDAFVARRRVVVANGALVDPEALCSTDLETLRAYFRRMGLYQMARSPEDDPVIIEVWM